MADISMATQSVPTAPSLGNVVIYADTNNSFLSVRDSAGVVRGHRNNFSTASQSPAAGTRTYITGSAIQIGTRGLQAGTCFRWTISVTKTAAGVAASTYTVAVGTAGTTADTDRLSFTKPAGTAAVDEGVIQIWATVRSVSAAGTMVGEFRMTHNLENTGHLVIPGVAVNTISAAFDTSAAGLFVGLTVTSGAADALTFQLVQAEAWNL